MSKNSTLQLFSKSDRVMVLSAKRRVQRVPDSSNSGSDLLKNNGFVYKWKLLTAFPVHCNRLSICLGFIIVSPLENYNTEHILLEVCCWAEYSGPWNGDNSWRVSLQKRYNHCIPTSCAGAARLWREGSSGLHLVERNLKNAHIRLNRHDLTLGCLGIIATSFLPPSDILPSYSIFFLFHFPAKTVLLPKCKVMKDLDSSSSLWSAPEGTLFPCVSRSFAQLMVVFST